MRGFSRTWPTKGPRWANPTAPSRRSVNERRPSRRVRRPQRDDRQLEQDDHRAGGFADNLVDQFECVTIGATSAKRSLRSLAIRTRGCLSRDGSSTLSRSDGPVGSSSIRTLASNSAPASGGRCAPSTAVATGVTCSALRWARLQGGGRLDSRLAPRSFYSRHCLRPSSRRVEVPAPTTGRCQLLTAKLVNGKHLGLEPLRALHSEVSLTRESPKP